MQMGERAAKRTNKMVSKIGDMYVGKHTGGGRRWAESYDRIDWGAADAEEAQEEPYPEARDVDFGEGPLGMEIEWGLPSTITNVVADGAAARAGVAAGSVIRRIGGRDASRPLPELELEDLMTRRPLQLRLGPPREGEGSRTPGPPDAVYRFGVAKVPAALSEATSSGLVDFVAGELERCKAEVQRDPKLALDRFSTVSTLKEAAEGALTGRWNMRLPLSFAVWDALQEMMRGGPGSLGATVEELAGGADAELWELGVVVSAPGARESPVEHEAPGRGTFTALVALGGVTKDMGPPHFLLGTHAEVAHARFREDPEALAASVEHVSALFEAGDAVLYDNAVLRSAGGNTSERRHMLLYASFKRPGTELEPEVAARRSLRRALHGRFFLRQFRDVAGDA